MVTARDRSILGAEVTVHSVARGGMNNVSRCMERMSRPSSYVASTCRWSRGHRPKKADLTVTCGARVTGDNRPSGHIVPERSLDLGHASARAEEGQLELFVLLAGGGLTGFVDLRVQLAG
jgi:hypothetical protein